MRTLRKEGERGIRPRVHAHGDGEPGRPAAPRATTARRPAPSRAGQQVPDPGRAATGAAARSAVGGLMAPAPRARLGAPRAITGSVARAHPARSQRRAILASAERIVKGDSDMLRRLSQGWQTRAFLYYEQCG